MNSPRYFFVFLILSLVFILPAFLKAEQNSEDVTIICQKQNEIRWMRAFKAESGRCKSLYSKEGYVQTVSSANNFQSCKTVMGNIKINIEEGGFKCKEVHLVSMIEI